MQLVPDGGSAADRPGSLRRLSVPLVLLTAMWVAYAVAYPYALRQWGPPVIHLGAIPAAITGAVLGTRLGLVAWAGLAILRPIVWYVDGMSGSAWVTMGAPALVLGLLSSTLAGLIADARRRERRLSAYLRDSEAWSRSLFEHSPAAQILLGRDGIVVDVNEMACRQIGHVREALVGRPVAALCPTAGAGQGQRLLREPSGQLRTDMRLAGGGALPMELTWRRLSRSSGDCILVAGRSVDEEQRAIEAARSSEAKARDLYTMMRLMCDNVPDMIWAKDLDQNFIFANRALCEGLLNAADTTEPVGKNDLFFAYRERASHPLDPDWHTFGEGCAGTDMVVAQTGASRRFDEAGQVRGRFLFLDVHKAPFFDASGTLIGTVGCGRDVTAERATEDALVRRNRELELLLRISQASTRAQDLDHVLDAILEETARCLGSEIGAIWLLEEPAHEAVCRRAIGRGSESIVGVRLPRDSRLVSEVIGRLKGLVVEDLREDSRVWRHGPEALAAGARSMVLAPLAVGGRVVGALNILHGTPGRFTPDDLKILDSLSATAALAINNADLFEQVQRDAQTKALLLREVNHRVQNNLTAIVGLVEARRRRAQDGRTTGAEALRDVSSRVRSLAVAHRLLSASAWGNLPIGDLVAQLIHASLQAEHSGAHVDVRVEPSPAEVSPFQSHHLALVIAELATNSAKYALGSRSSARISVGFTAPASGGCSLVFTDDGPGFPASVLDEPSNGCGLDVVRSIVTQTLNGSVSFENDGGAAVRIHLPPADARRQALADA